MLLVRRHPEVATKLYMTPGSCSTGIHILLEDLELSFEAHVVDLMAGDHLRPDKYTGDPDLEKSVEARGRSIVERGFARLDAALAGRDYVADRFSIADATPFYLEFWADRIDIELPAGCAAHIGACCLDVPFSRFSPKTVTPARYSGIGSRDEARPRASALLVRQRWLRRGLLRTVAKKIRELEERSFERIA